MTGRIDIGMRGEELAATYLSARGWSIAARRWRDGTPHGLKTDIDIVALSPDGVYHFVEVKTRTAAPGPDRRPEAAVTPAKAQRMIRAAERYMAAGKLDGEIAIDLIAVVLDGGSETPVIRYYADVAR